MTTSWTIFTALCVGIVVIMTASGSADALRRLKHRKHKVGTVSDPIPDAWDWRDKGAVLPVIDQGESGNSLAIVVAEAVSAYGFIKSGKLVKASTQELLDCCFNGTTPQLTHKSAQADDVYDCIVGLHGLCWGADYPPVINPEACMADKCAPEIVIKGGYSVKPMNETDLKAAVYANPAAVILNAASISFQTYQSGVYDDTSCDPTMLDHALLVVGYGQLEGQDVWICKNSWGADWGEKGYIYIARGKNICGIASDASIPI
ncbi:digestive cysteine proteinase 2-like [Paramacrobiotus metropolitanus]|uniref:digestive cysteine proteinase 2-like n=1 Tax=Paramacrobiotus metropolitanus TaxID=2943436 RepID=UPI00244658BB|nr:digestive cysteine proteinase 2-like [Paramacrobiotus metropolitanus]